MSTTEPTRRSILDRVRRRPRPTPPSEPASSGGESSASIDRSAHESEARRRRMETAYLAGYDERIRAGLGYHRAGSDARAASSALLLQAKVATYQELDQLTAILDRDLPGAERFSDPESAGRPITPPADIAIERAAHLAGRWYSLDPVITNQLDYIEEALVDVADVGSVTLAGDSREAWFYYQYADAHDARQGLTQIDRDTTERLAREASAAPTPAVTEAEAPAAVPVVGRAPEPASEEVEVPRTAFADLPERAAEDLQIGITEGSALLAARHAADASGHDLVRESVDDGMEATEHFAEVAYGEAFTAFIDEHGEPQDGRADPQVYDGWTLRAAARIYAAWSGINDGTTDSAASLGGLGLEHAGAVPLDHPAAVATFRAHADAAIAQHDATDPAASTQRAELAARLQAISPTGPAQTGIEPQRVIPRAESSAARVPGKPYQPAPAPDTHTRATSPNHSSDLNR